jgi:hypothetical protein
MRCVYEGEGEPQRGDAEEEREGGEEEAADEDELRGPRGGEGEGVEQQRCAGDGEEEEERGQWVPGPEEGCGVG